MGQKANILTLRSYREQLHALSFNTKEFWNAQEFINTLKRGLEKKGILITFYNMNTSAAGDCCLTLHLFYKTQKLMRYKKKINKKRQVNHYKSVNNVLKNLFNNNFSMFNIFTINQNVDTFLLKFFFRVFKNFKHKIFSRRFNLFIDFAKLTTLFIDKNLSLNIYLKLLGTIFKVLPKKTHSRFFIFLKLLFKHIIEQEESKIKGIKFVINGKLKGKLRSSSSKILEGKIEMQTINSTVDFSKAHVHTIYGCFGLKMWVNYYKKPSSFFAKKQVRFLKPNFFIANATKKSFFFKTYSSRKNFVNGTLLHSLKKNKKKSYNNHFKTKTNSFIKENSGIAKNKFKK